MKACSERVVLDADLGTELTDKPIESSDPLMNNRAGRLVGQTALVTKAIEGGEGRVRIA